MGELTMTEEQNKLTSTDSDKAYKQAEAIVNPKYVITDILPL